MCEYGSDFVQSAIAQILESLGAERQALQGVSEGREVCDECFGMTAAVVFGSTAY